MSMNNKERDKNQGVGIIILSMIKKGSVHTINYLLVLTKLDSYGETFLSKKVVMRYAETHNMN